MPQEEISKERMNYTISLLIAMIVEEITETTGEESQAVIISFLKSKTGKALCDVSTRLWWEGPSSIVDMYLEEIKGENNMTDDYFNSMMKKGLAQAISDDSSPAKDVFAELRKRV